MPVESTQAWKTGTRYAITYETDRGERTARIIDLLRISHAGDGRVFLKAFCHLRGEERTFRTDRVIDARIVEPPSAAASIQSPSLMLESRRISLDDQNADEEIIRKPAVKKPKGIVLSILVYAACLAYLPSVIARSGDSKSSSSPVASSSLSPSPPRVTPPIKASQFDAIAAIRTPLFIKATGLSDQALIQLYLHADTNESGRLSYDELAAFQKKTFQRFKYLQNDTALRPDEFLAAGGGDCDDFALYTAGLLRFWGWEPYLGTMMHTSSNIGHAICLSYEPASIPPTFTFFTLSSGAAEDGSSLKPGKYVPIDYDNVGSLSNAVDTRAKLSSIYIPEKAWGLSM